MSGFVTIKRRSKNLLVYGGITVMTGAAMLGVGGAVFAQDASTPAAGSSVSGAATPTASERGSREAEYAAFLDALAVNLGVADGETVDAAIRTTMKQLVDERLAAGEISADRATELKAAVDSGDYPVRFHLPGLRGHHRLGGGEHSRGGDVGRPDRDGDAEDSDDAATDDGDTSDDILVPDTGTPTAGSGATG